MTKLRRRDFLAAVSGVLAAHAAPLAVRAAEGGAHAFTLPGIDGQPLNLADYAGKPILIVNTASFCGFTGQYQGLQELWSAYRDQGFVLIGAPSADFNQEYGTSDEVKTFCEVNFSIDFPMSELLSVRGANAHPLFQWLAANSAEPQWNFNKYLIDGNGRFVKRYGATKRPSAIAPDIEELLNS